MATVDWYFDFVSPFAYLQSEQLHLLGPKTRVRYRPVLFAALLAAHAHKGPAEIPRKRAFTYRFALWEARRLSIPFKMPHEHPFNPLPLLRLVVGRDPCLGGNGQLAFVIFDVRRSFMAMACGLHAASWNCPGNCRASASTMASEITSM